MKTIVRNEVYLGHMVQNKRGTVSYKDHKQIDKPKDQWIRVENTHEPIIDQETWDLAVEIDRMHTHPRNRSGNGISTFGGLLYCMDCGYAMRHQTEHHKRKNGTVAAYISYVCGKYSMSGRTACSTHNIYETALSKVVLADIRMKAELVDIDEKAVVEKITEKLQSHSSQETAAIKKTAKALTKRLAELEKLIAATYEDKVKGTIPEAVCVELLNKYQAERTEKADQLRNLEQQLEDTHAVENDVQAWADLIRQYRSLETLDRETILRLIDKIEIGAVRIVDGQKERDIRIHYKFVGYIG